MPWYLAGTESDGASESTQQSNAAEAQTMSVAGMLAPDGRCKVLDAAADGYVRAEDCIAFLLGTTPHTTPDSSGHAVAVLGSAVNQDGRSSSLTAPNGPSQQQASRRIDNTGVCSQAAFCMLASQAALARVWSPG